MSSASNIEWVRQWVEQVWNQGNLDLLSRFHPLTFENHGRPSTIEEAKQWHLRTRATYPDVHYSINDIFGDGDKVAVRWTATGTQRGALWGIIPPTNKCISWSGMHMLRIVNDQIVEVWAVADNIALLQQLDIKLEPASR